MDDHVSSSGYIYAGETVSELRINGNDYGKTIYPIYQVAATIGRLNTVGASAIASGNDTVSRRGSFIDGTCLSQLG